MNLFEIANRSLKVSYNGEVFLLVAKKNVSIISNELYKVVPRISLYNINGGYNEALLNLPLSNCSEDGINPFTVDSFVSFAETNLGF